MDAIKRGASRFLRTALWLAVVLVVAVAAEFITPLHDLDTTLAADPGLKGTLVGLAIGLWVAGLLLLVGTQLVVRVGDEYPLSEAEIERMAVPRRAPTVWRRFSYRLRGLKAGSGFSDEASFHEFKQAWKGRAWRAEPRWRRFFMMALGAMLMILGIFGLLFVVGPPFVKLLSAGAVAYATVQMAVGFARA